MTNVKSCGYILKIDPEYVQESIDRLIFGQKAECKQIISKIMPEDNIILCDGDTENFYCGFQAEGPGGYEINKTAFDGIYPSQVKVKIVFSRIIVLKKKDWQDIINLRGEISDPIYLKPMEMRFVYDTAHMSGYPYFIKVRTSKDLNNAKMKIRKSRKRDLSPEQKDNENSVIDNARNHKKQLLSYSQDIGALSNDSLISSESQEFYNGEYEIDSLSTSLKKYESNLYKESTSHLEIKNSTQTPYLQLKDIGEEIEVNEDIIESYLSNFEKRKTIALGPLPPENICPAAAITALINIHFNSKYEFLMIRENPVRHLLIHFRSNRDVVRFLFHYSDKSWYMATEGILDSDEIIKTLIYKNGQGINFLLTEYGDRGIWLISDLLILPELMDEQPYFFKLNHQINLYEPKTAIELSLKKPNLHRLREFPYYFEFLENGIIKNFIYDDFGSKDEEYVNGILRQVAKECEMLKKDMSKIIEIRYNPQVYSKSKYFEAYKNAFDLMIKNIHFDIFL